MLLIIIPAAFLLFYEITRIGTSSSSSNIPSTTKNQDHDRSKSKSKETIVKTNLNRLDPTTHVVAGVRERKSPNQ